MCSNGVTGKEWQTKMAELVSAADSDATSASLPADAGRAELVSAADSDATSASLPRADSDATSASLPADAGRAELVYPPIGEHDMTDELLMLKRMIVDSMRKEKGTLATARLSRGN